MDKEDDLRSHCCDVTFTQIFGLAFCSKLSLIFKDTDDYVKRPRIGYS